MMRPLLYRLALIAALESALCVPGLPAQSKILKVRDWNLSLLDPGAKVEVGFFLARKPLSGRYLGTTETTEKEYAGRFALARGASEGGAASPALGEPIALVDVLGKLYEGEFAGFDRGFLLLRIGGAAEAISVNLERIASLRDAAGAHYDMHRLRSKVRSGDMPFRSLLVLNTRAGRSLTPLNEIAWIEAAGEKSRVAAVVAVLVVGFLVGSYVAIKNARWDIRIPL
jgi:hypothetical protein